MTGLGAILMFLYVKQLSGDMTYNFLGRLRAYSYTELNLTGS